MDLLLRFARASRANLVLHAWRHGIGGIGPTARVGFVAGEFWWLPSFAGGVCQGRLEFVSCLDGHLPSLSLTTMRPGSVPVLCALRHLYTRTIPAIYSVSTPAGVECAARRRVDDGAGQKAALAEGSAGRSR